MLFVSLLVLMLSVLAFVIRNVFDKRRREEKIEDAVEHRKSDEEMGGDEGDCKDSGSLVE